MKDSKRAKRELVKNAEPLPQEEWDFRGSVLPESELLACALFEYARELTKVSLALRKLLATLAASLDAPKGSAERSRHWTHSSNAASFLNTPFGSPIIRPDMAAVPWQKLADFEKERGVKQARQISFGKGAHVCGPWQIGDDTPLPSFVDYAASYASAGEVLHGDSSAIEFWFLAIDWNFPREKIEKVILSWLNGQIAQKRGRVPRFSRQGKDKSDFARSWLMALGAKRLLDSGLTVPDASKYSARVSGAIPSPLFTDKSEWSKARRRAETRLALLFPAAELGE